MTLWEPKRRDVARGELPRNATALVTFVMEPPRTLDPWQPSQSLCPLPLHGFWPNKCPWCLKINFYSRVLTTSKFVKKEKLLNVDNKVIVYFIS